MGVVIGVLTVIYFVSKIIEAENTLKAYGYKKPKAIRRGVVVLWFYVPGFWVVSQYMINWYVSLLIFTFTTSIAFWASIGDPNSPSPPERY